MSDETKKLYQKIFEFNLELNELNDAILLENKSQLEVKGTLKSFELCLDLSWKIMRSYLVWMGLQVFPSPKEAIDAAFQNGIIENQSLWKQMIVFRNRMTHAYDRDSFFEATEIIKDFYIELAKFNDWLGTVNLNNDE